MKLVKVALSFAFVAAVGSYLYYLNHQQPNGQWKTWKRTVTG